MRLYMSTAWYAPPLSHCLGESLAHQLFADVLLNEFDVVHQASICPSSDLR